MASTSPQVEEFDERNHAWLESGVFYGLNPSNMLKHSNAVAERIVRPETIERHFRGSRHYRARRAPAPTS